MGRKHRERASRETSNFERWTKRWTERHPVEDLPESIHDPDFQDFLRAAYQYFSIAPQEESDATQVACVVYQMAMDYSEERARRDEPTGYRRTTAA